MEILTFIVVSVAVLYFLGMMDQAKLAERRSAQRRELDRREAESRRRMDTALRTGVVHHAHEDDVAVCVEQGVPEPCEVCASKTAES